MSIRATTALVNAQAQGFGMKELLADFRIYGYSGLQPSIADLEPVGVNLFIVTKDGGVFTGATKAVGTVTLTGAAGQVDSIQLGGMAENLLGEAQVFATDLTALAVLVAAEINANMNFLNITADNTLGVVNLYAPSWQGALVDGLAVASSGSGGITATPADFAGGVTALNGCNFDFPAADGLIGKPPADVWSSTGIVAGTAGWFRVVPAGSAAAGDGAGLVRFDGSLATSGGDMEIGSLAIAVGAVQTVTKLDITMPKASGMRFYRELKEDPELSSIPVVIVTAVTGYAGDPDEFKKFMSTRKQVPPPEGFIAKPIDKDELLETVAGLLA